MDLDGNYEDCIWWEVLFEILESRDIIAVTAAGSQWEYTFPADCEYKSLIVASSSDNHRLARFAKSDENYVYAPGVVEPSPEGRCPSHEGVGCEGTGISAGQVSGLVAYLLALSAQQEANNNPEFPRLTGYNNGPVVADHEKRWVKMNDFLLDRLSKQRPVVGGDVSRRLVAEIWNGGDTCFYDDPPRMKRDGTDGIFCTRPSSSTSTISTIPTHHALNNNGSSTLTTLSTLQLISSSRVLTT